MDAKDLRIGNYIYNIGDALTIVDVDIMHDISIQSKTSPRYYPITLTEEWLTDHTLFECDNDGYFCLRFISIIRNERFNCFNVFIGGQAVNPIGSVHELQNLWKTNIGEELTIK